MASLSHYMETYKQQLERGEIQRAHRGLMDYFSALKSTLKEKHPDFSVSEIYPGYMDMTYFSFTSPTLKNLKLKVAIVFVYDKFRFEVWLAGQNRQLQGQYWQLLKKENYSQYSVPASIKGIDAIVEHVVVENPCFDDLDGLTGQIEGGVLRFIEDMERFLSSHL
ncbi:MAG: DUF7000 family protein [Candidatus Bathyarchaeia archaeon]|jgi:hypothetical protein